MKPVTIRVLEGFDDPTFGSERWEELLRRSGNDVVYLTWEWQRTWWETFGDGQLLLILAERDGQDIALAPLYAESGVVLFVGTGFESGYLDFIGDISDRNVLGMILETARDRVDGFLGFNFDFVADTSATGKLLADAGRRLGLACLEDWNVKAPILDFAGCPEAAVAATKKKDSVSHERSLRRDGLLTVLHLRDGEAIRAQLDDFFQQHISRWAITSTPSCFLEQRSRLFVERLTKAMAHTGWLRFTRMDWNGQPIAFQYGFCYRGRYFKETSTHALELRRYAPGQVLLRQLFLAAIEEGVRTFDFGIGEQQYKLRFATHLNQVQAWRLYPASSPVAFEESFNRCEEVRL